MNLAQREAIDAAVIQESRRIRRSDFDEPWLCDRAEELKLEFQIHRKLWEYCVIAEVYLERLASAQDPLAVRALGFGVGLEPLPAWIASQGAEVLATDQETKTSGSWSKTEQHAAGKEALPWSGIIDPRSWDHLVSFQSLDMTDIPADLRLGEFDFAWSSGSLEHIGGVEAGLQFFCRQMECLRPGGIAAHTTELNHYESSHLTLESPSLSLFVESQLEDLSRRLEAQGDRLWDLRLAIGELADDTHIARVPNEVPHLNYRVSGFVTTSVLLVAERGGAGGERSGGPERGRGPREGSEGRIAVSGPRAGRWIRVSEMRPPLGVRILFWDGCSGQSSMVVKDLSEIPSNFVEWCREASS